VPHARVPEPYESGVASVVHGFIRTTEGAPVEGAILTLLSKGGRQLDRVPSLADGSYIVAAPSAGAYLLAATAPGHASRARHIMVADEPLVYDVELARGEADADADADANAVNSDRG
jgi:RND superfamily putative drug exporter